jgi:quinol monooxygenase YgiN
MIRFSLRLVVPAAKRQEIVSGIGALLAPARVQPDCVSARLQVDADDAGAITLVQEWASRTQLDRYLASGAGRLLLEAMESASIEPEVRFDTIGRTDGMEVISQARQQQAGTEGSRAGPDHYKEHEP